MDLKALDQVKLQKLDKLLTKIDNDFKKKQKDITKPKLIEIMKTTHEIYQIVLYEISEMLEAAHLSELRLSLNKIYNGQNVILNYILKLNTNFEVQADKMMDDLKKNQQQPRRKSVDQGEVEKQETNKMATQMVQLQPIVKKMIRKTFAEKGTDTGDDMREARNQNTLKQKEKELLEMQEEIDDEGKQIAEFLKNRKAEVMAVGESKAQNNLKEVLKDLGRKKRETNNIEEEALAFEEEQNKQNEQMKNIETTLKESLREAQKQQQEKAKDDIKAGKALVKNGVLVYLETQSVQTDKVRIEVKDNYEKQRKEQMEKDQKIIQMEKKVKDIQIERDAYAQQLASLNQQISKINMDKKKIEDLYNEEKKKKEKQLAEQQAVVTKADSDKIRRVIEENIRMKMRIKNLIDNVAALEKEINRNYERFKLFIQNSPLTDEQKKTILAQAENLFKLNFGEKLNIQELKEVLQATDLLKDPLFKQICGSDLVQMTKNVKKEETIRKQKIAKLANYDPLFDPEFLNPDEKIIVRRVKKMVKKQNSKGEWVEEEIEVDEEVVVNGYGEEVRVRDKPIVVQQSKETQNFVDQYGGFAIGGAKINIPNKPQAKDGKEVKMGEWFEDSQGKKVRKMQGKDGEETYEVEEEFVDEYGRKQKRTKQMKVKKDRNGNEVIEEEFIGEDGKRQRVAKRVTKDKDGNDIIEEIIVDEYGNKLVKKQRVYKDKDGNEIMEEEIVDAKGNKQVIRRKILKDENGNQIIIEEKIDSKGNKTITTRRKNEFGQEIVEQQIVDRFGRVQTLEKKMFVDESGAMVVEEISIDAKGNKVVKRTKVRRDKDGNEMIEEEMINPDGTITTKNLKKTKNRDGTETIAEEHVDAKGNTMQVQKKVYKDKNGNTVIEEEKIDPITGDKIVVKKVRDAQGREVVQQQIIKADGTVINIEKKVQKDQDGNHVEVEHMIDDEGKQVTIQRKQFKDKDGIEVKEEVTIDENGQKKIVRTKVIRDKDGHDIIEETIINPDGTKQVIRKKVYRDKDGNEITEVETQDEHGNRVIVKKKVNQRGEEIVEEIKIQADGKIEKKITKTKKDKDGNEIIEETTINSDGTKTVKVIRQGVDDKVTQTEGSYYERGTLDQLLEQLAEMGIEKSKLEKIRNWVQLKQQISQKKIQKINQQQSQQLEEAEEQFRPGSGESQKSLDTLDDEESEQDQADRLYKKMMNNKSGGLAELMRQVRNGLGKQGNEQISQEEFREYLNKMRQVHQKCGDNCPHLRRFYEKLGFIQKKYKRRFLKMKDTKIEAKTKLPYIQNVSQQLK